MKKLLLLLTLIALFTSCDPIRNNGGWYVKNDTEQSLKFKFPGFSVREGGYDLFYHTYTIPSGGKINIYGSDQSKNSPACFDCYFQKIINLHGEDVYWQILSEDNVVLRTWNYRDKGLHDQRFFDESAWSLESGKGSTFIDMFYDWTFDISPEDIQLED